MAENPQLFGNGMPVPFHGELFVLARDGVEFHVDKIPGGFERIGIDDHSCHGAEALLGASEGPWCLGGGAKMPYIIMSSEPRR